MDYLIRVPFFIFVFLLSGYLYFDSMYHNLSGSEYNLVSLDKVDETYISSAGSDKNYANIVAIQPFMYPADYSSKERFFNKLESYLLKAKSNGFLKDHTTIIFPDHIGTPLYLSYQRKEVYTSQTLENALSFYNSPKYPFLEKRIIKTQNELINEILDTKYKDVAEMYTSTFSDLAKIYKVNILSGTVVLPQLSINDGKIVFTGKDRKVYGFMFNSSGLITQKVERRHIFNFEKEFIVSGNPPEEGIVVPGISNKMAVIISADTLSPLSYTRIIQVTDLWVSPSIKPSAEIPNFSDAKFSGELQNPSKSLFKDSDSLLTNREQWHKFSITGRHASTSSKSYIQVFLNGEFYDIKLDSWSCYNVKNSGKQDFVDPKKTSAIINVFL